MNAAIDHIQVVDVVNAAVAIHNRRLRIIPHPARARLMLPAAERVTGNPVKGEGLRCARFFQPCLGLGRQKLRSDDVVFMTVPGKASDRNSPVVADSRVGFDTRGEDRHFLNRTHDVNAAAVEPA